TGSFSDPKARARRRCGRRELAHRLGAGVADKHTRRACDVGTGPGVRPSETAGPTAGPDRGRICLDRGDGHERLRRRDRTVATPHISYLTAPSITITQGEHHACRDNPRRGPDRRSHRRGWAEPVTAG